MRYLTTTEVAAMLHVDPSRVRLLCKLGRIETIKVGNTYAISEHELGAVRRDPRRPPGRPRKVAAQADHRDAGRFRSRRLVMVL